MAKPHSGCGPIKPEHRHKFTAEDIAKSKAAKLAKKESPEPPAVHTPAVLVKINRYQRRLGGKALAAKIAEAADNQELVSVSDNIALTDGFIFEELDSLDLEQCGAAWERLEQISAQSIGDKDNADYHLQRMRGVVEEGVEQWQKVGRIRSLQEDRRRLVETQLKVEDKAKTTIHQKQLAGILSDLQEQIFKVFDRHQVSVLAVQEVGLILASVWLGEIESKMVPGVQGGPGRTDPA